MAEPIQPFAFTPPTGYTPGTAVTVTPYNKAGAPPIYVVAGVPVGSEEDVLMTLKNQLFKPPVKLV